MRTALYTTFYPAAWKYFAAWYDSVCSQTDREFDIWIGLDAISRREAEEHLGRTVSANWMQNDCGGSPADMRNKAFYRLAGEYDQIVLTDADDVLEGTRMAAARRELAANEVAGCALRMIDKEGRDLKPVFMPDGSDRIDEILLRHNVFGLSNSAYRAEVLARCLPIPPDCILIDWLLVTRAWSLGARLSFDYVPRMYYRQYEANIASVLPPFSEPQVAISTTRVLTHYSYLLHSTWPLPPRCRKEIEDAQAEVQAFRHATTSSPRLLKRYVSALNSLEPKYVWWWCVANSALEKLWKN
jgi:hypothetical protein